MGFIVRSFEQFQNGTIPTQNSSSEEEAKCADR